MICAIVPVKALHRAKGRLAVLLSEDERRRLALAMLEDVLRALQAVAAVDITAVVSPDADALSRAEALGALSIPEPPACRGVSQALAHASAVLEGRGAEAVIVLAADIPTVRPDDVAAVLDALPDLGVAIAPTDDRGTAALALRPPGVIPFRYGRNSSALHKREAAARGLPARVLRLPSLSRDIDGPDDVAELLRRPAETATHALLAALALAGRPGVRGPA